MTSAAHDGRAVGSELSVSFHADEDLVSTVTQSVRPTLEPAYGDRLEASVRDVLDRLGPVRVTSYLGLLVERQLRDAVPAQRRSVH